MREVDTKTGGQKSTRVDGDVVRMVHTTLHKASDKHYQLTTTFDFEGVARDEIVRLAAEALLIRWRTAFKGAETVSDDDDHQEVKVLDMLAKSRKPVDKVGKAVKEVNKLTAEERAALLAMLQE